MNMEAVFGLRDRPILDKIFAIDNRFIRQLATLTVDSARSLKVVSFVMRDKAQNRGEIQQRGVRAADKSVVDICKLTPLVGGEGIRNLLEEVAYYRYHSLNLSGQAPDFWKGHAHVFMADYLLASCLCYVEVFDAGGNVDKYFATRNRFLAGALAGKSEEESREYNSYLETYVTNYATKQLKVLKVRHNKSGFKIVKPRGYLDFNRNVKITPIFFMSLFVDEINSILRERMVRFKYLKDNLIERELITTLSPEILLKYYEQEDVEKMISNVGSKLDRGYIKLPELGLSKYDQTGVRALNITRITSLEMVNEFDTRFINVDFDNIMPAFKATIDNIRHPQILAAIYEDLAGERPEETNPMMLRVSINAYVDSQYVLGTTQALRFLHMFMLQRPKIFVGYDGLRRDYSITQGRGFNLGGEE